METFILILELLGAMTGLRKNMDIFGICILGLTTAVGGGVVRDLILGNTPPATFQDPIYATVAILTSLVLFLPGLRRILMRNPVWFDWALRLMDSLGLGIFTVVGIRIAHGCVENPSLFLLVFVGTVTGVGGGLMRDIMAGDTPYIFVKHVYASASLAGAVLCSALWDIWGELPAMLIGMSVVVVIRILSAHYRWNLPRAKD